MRTGLPGAHGRARGGPGLRAHAAAPAPGGRPGRGGADAAFPVALPACNRLETATITSSADQLVDHGIATDEEIDLHLANVAAGRLDLTQPPMIACLGPPPAPEPLTAAAAAPLVAPCRVTASW
jgi:hypothetical protein